MPATPSADYLVVGAGASGMAFVDTLVADTDATVVMVDRRDGAGGHWRDAYPFVRLHQPSACYGIASMPLGGDGPDPESPDEDFGERATGAEIVAYYDAALEMLEGTGRVSFLGGADYLGDRRVRLASGEVVAVDAAKVVDATRMQAEVPSTSPPKFEVGPGVRWVPAGDVDHGSEPDDGYVVIGAGKTSQDTVIHLLDRGVDPDAITWIRPRDPWLVPRRYFQPGRGLPTTLAGFARSIEIAATAESVEDLIHRSEDDGLLVRIDPTVEPGTYRGATISDNELAKLRTVRDVVRLGYVRRIDETRIELDDGGIPTGPGRLHVHCTASGLHPTPTVPVFDGDTITPQMIRFGMQPYCAALIARIEATIVDEGEKNRLCRPMPYPDGAADLARMLAGSLRTDHHVLSIPDLAQWVDACRLNVSAGLMSMGDDPKVQQSLGRYGASAGAAAENLKRILAG